MKRLFIHIGLQRCGNHAISNWILKQRDGFAEASLEHISHDVFSLPYQSQPVYFLNSQKLEESVSQQRGYALKEMEFPSDVMIGIETGSLKQYDEERMLGDIFEGYKIIRIISLRDAWNCYASFFKKYFAVGQHISSGWEERAEEILGKTNYLKQDFTFISYNHWFSSIEYRKDLCDKLGLLFTDKGINDVPKFGNGSSFDQVGKDGHASSMNVLSRYKEFEKDRRFLSYMKPYTQMLSKKVFKYEHRPDE